MKFAIGIPIIGSTAHVNHEIRKDQYERLLPVLAANCLQPVTKNSTFNGEDWTTVIAAEIMNIDEKEGG